MSLPNFRTYNELVYSLQDRYPCIRRSTLVLAPIGATMAKLEGQVMFDDVTLDVWELLDFDTGHILNYSYKVYQGKEKLYWYAPFEHPHIAELAGTYPHHKHVPPDIKHNRVPAPDISFDRPNPPILIEEIERDLLSS